MNGAKRRIIVVSPVFGGSFPIASYAVQALCDLGHDAVLLDMRCFGDTYRYAEQTRNSALFYRRTRTHIVHAIETHSADLLVALAQAPIKAPLLANLRQRGVATAWWFVEHHQRFRSWRAVAPHYDFVFSIQREPCLAELRALGAVSVEYLPLAASKEHHRPRLDHERLDPNYVASLAFFGSPHRNRVALFEALANKDLALWGEGWSKVEGPLASAVREGSQFLDDTVERSIYWGADIVLNPHSTHPAEEHHDFVNPRTFVAAACGAFQLVDERELLGEHFVIGEEIATYSSAEDLVEQIAYYQGQPSKRRRIAEAGMRRVHAEHTYERRMRQMLERVFGSGSRAA